MPIRPIDIDGIQINLTLLVAVVVFGYTKIQSIYEPLCEISHLFELENVSSLEDNKHFGSSALNSEEK